MDVVKKQNKTAFLIFFTAKCVDVLSTWPLYINILEYNFGLGFG